MTASNQRDIKWADGLRGIAAIFVVTSHLTLGFAEHLTHPSSSQYLPPSWYNLPIIRIFAEGVPWVAIFMLLTGFVNATGPIKKARAGNVEASLLGLASSTFRRTSRLVLPCTIATVFAWAICQIGGYKVGIFVDSDWMRNTSALPAENIGAAFVGLFREIWRTWSCSDNIYDKNQWTMQFFLKASMLLFVALLGTVRAVPRYRVGIFCGLFILNWAWKDTLIGIPVFGGALLAEASLHPAVTAFSTSHTLAARIPRYYLVILGLLLISYPSHNASWAPWSRALEHAGHALFPAGAELQNFYPAVGVQLLTLGIVLSATLQRLLAHPLLLWLGQLSFPIYLLHGPLLRSLLNWLLFYGATVVGITMRNKEGKFEKEVLRFQRPGVWRFVLALPVFWAALLWAANWWCGHVEPWCARVTKALEERICGMGDGGEGEKGVVMLLPTTTTNGVLDAGDAAPRLVI